MTRIEIEMIICEPQRGSDHCFALHFISVLDFPISATDSCNGFSFQAQKQSTCQPCDSSYSIYIIIIYEQTNGTFSQSLCPALGA